MAPSGFTRPNATLRVRLSTRRLGWPQNDARVSMVLKSMKIFSNITFPIPFQSETVRSHPSTDSL